MTTRVRVPDSVLGIDGPGGQRWNRDRKGYVHIDDPTQGRLARKALGHDMGDASIGFVGTDLPSITCECHFEAFAWCAGQPCPRCGRPLPSKEEAA